MADCDPGRTGTAARREARSTATQTSSVPVVWRDAGSEAWLAVIPH